MIINLQEDLLLYTHRNIDFIAEFASVTHDRTKTLEGADICAVTMQDTLLVTLPILLGMTSTCSSSVLSPRYRLSYGESERLIATFICETRPACY